MRFIFLVQIEGRGHMTQAMQMKNLLERAGHEVVHVFLGKGKRRAAPPYFEPHFTCPVERIHSPNFITDRHRKRIRVVRSALKSCLYLGQYFRSCQRIHQVSTEKKADAIISFCDFLGGCYQKLFQPKSKLITVGHQFLATHPDFPHLPHRQFERWMYQLSNYFMGWGADLKIALSFAPYAPLPAESKTIICPPLLRDDLPTASQHAEDYFLAYVVNDGYADDIMTWQSQNPEVCIHLFSDRKTWKVPHSPQPNLTCHPLNASSFLEKMSRCKGLITTAGFESVTEAMHLGKKVFMMPVARQYEQATNAIDAQNAGAGITADHFDIQLLIDHLQVAASSENPQRQWFSLAEEQILKGISELWYKQEHLRI